MPSSSTTENHGENHLFHIPSLHLHSPTCCLFNSFQNSFPSFLPFSELFPIIFLCKVEPCKKHLKLASQLISTRRSENFQLNCWHLCYTQIRHGLERLRSPNAIVPYRHGFYSEKEE